MGIESADLCIAISYHPRAARKPSKSLNEGRAHIGYSSTLHLGEPPTGRQLHPPPYPRSLWPRRGGRLQSALQLVKCC